jgi:peptide subunit release factor RF-3
MPIFTFVNKMDRPGRDPFDLIGEVEDVLGIGVYPMTWPCPPAPSFRGVYHRLDKRDHLFDAQGRPTAAPSEARRRRPASTTRSSDRRTRRPGLRERAPRRARAARRRRRRPLDRERDRSGE